MKRIKLYIAASLDGYIARPDGNLDWLTEFPNPDQVDYGYHDFYDGIDTVIMGSSTYQEIISFPVAWPYADCDCYVVSRQENLSIDSPRTKRLGSNWPERVKELQLHPGKDIWLVGGGKLIGGFMEHGLLDELHLTIVPMVLGEGIPLFPAGSRETHFELADYQGFESGIINIVYIRRISPYPRHQSV